MLCTDKRESEEDMKKRTYKLTEKQKKAALRYYKKGITTQDKLARKLKVSKQKIASFLKAKKIGKRVTQPFWGDVKTIREMKRIPRKEAIKEVKFAPKWFEKRQARLKGVEKERDKMREIWHRYKTGKIDKTIFDEPETIGIMESMQYD